MTKPNSDYTIEELKAKIEAIKAERERTSDALKRYEEELERRKQEIHLGIPDVGAFCLSPCNSVISTESFNGWAQSLLYDALNIFSSEESSKKHAEMLLAWRMALVANSKGEPIDITVLLPLMKKGWVAMDKNGVWCWYKYKPFKETGFWYERGPMERLPYFFNIKPAENWEDSLKEIEE